MKINKRKRSTYNKADIATIRIDNHEKLCRIMQKETHEKIDNICFRIKTNR